MWRMESRNTHKEIERETMNLPPYLKPIDITQEGADQKIREAGELARAMICFDLICEEHGLFMREVQEEHIDREMKRDREQEKCWHEVRVK